MVKIKCNEQNVEEVREFLKEEVDKNDYNPDLSGIKLKKDCILMKGLYYGHYPILEDGKIVYVDDEDRGPGDIFRAIKEKYIDVEIEGALEYKDDDYSIDFYFSSPKGEVDVKEDYAYDNRPLSECWFSYIANTDYGVELIAFSTKSDFKMFLADLEAGAEEYDMDLEDFIESEECEEYLTENDYRWPSDDAEAVECYYLALKKYEKNDDQQDDLCDQKKKFDGEDKYKEVRKIFDSILEDDSTNVLKNLLLYVKSDNSLDKNGKSDDLNISTKEIYNRGIICFGDYTVQSDCMNKNNDCFIGVELRERNEGLEAGLTITVYCKPNICEMEGYRNRMLEIAAVIEDKICGKELAPYGKIHFFQIDSMSDFGGYTNCSLGFSVCDDEYKLFKDDINHFEGYDKDISIIINDLLNDPLLRKSMDIEDVSAEDIFKSGYFRTYAAFSPQQGESYKSWLTFLWGITYSDFTIKIDIMSLEKKRLDPISSIIKNKVSGLVLPVRGCINYSELFSVKKDKLGKDLFYSELSFRNE